MKKTKKWTSEEELELELDRCYLTLQLTYPELAKRFHCTITEIRRKLKEMDSLQ